MGTWNYRVIKHQPEKGHVVLYAVHEVYYNDDGSTNGHTENAIWPVGETIEELRSDINRMLLALDRPVIEVTD